MQILKAGVLYFALVFGACFVLVAEFTLVLRLRGLSISEYLSSQDPVSGTVFYAMLGVFTIMPLLVARR